MANASHDPAGADVDLPRAGGSPSSRSAVAEERSTKRTVLIVEDNHDAAESLRDLLELSGHVAAVAFDGRSGLTRAREMRPDVVLCDVGLPDIDGYQLARTLRSEPTLAGTLLVALTGYADPEHQRRALEAGFDAHLAKPPPLEVLAAILRTGHP